MSKSKDVSNYRRKRKQNLIQVLGGKCQICGFDLFVDALEFHHEDPSQKEYALSEKGICHDIEADLNEVKNVFYYVPIVIEEFIVDIMKILPNTYLIKHSHSN